MCVKNNTEEWVDEETFEAIRVRDKSISDLKSPDFILITLTLNDLGIK